MDLDIDVGGGCVALDRACIDNVYSTVYVTVILGCRAVLFVDMNVALHS